MTETKRITFQNSRGLTLVGHLSLESSDKIVIMSPGSCSDKSSQGRFDVYARRLNENGISALAIDFSGCGESDDDSLTIEKEVDDLKSAIKFVRSQGYTKIGLYGNSLGGLISLIAFSPDIQTIAMTGGLTGPRKFDWEKLLTVNQKQELQEYGHVTVRDSHNMDRKEVILDKTFFQDFERVNQEEILRRVSCPVFMIHGDGDEEERSGHHLSQVALTYLPQGSKIELLLGAGHGFWGYIDEVAELLTQWFLEKL
ncbi:MAG: alpha/beta hydrolase [Proteobacteria bacterium]|nr:alpha/beta hydrolase [Pseudomonadota bacterium]